MLKSKISKKDFVLAVLANVAAKDGNKEIGNWRGVLSGWIKC